MSSDYNQQNLINNISPDKVSFYLKNNGWIKKAENKKIGSIWQLKNNKDISLILPLDQKYSDFQNRLFEIILILEEVENRPRSEIYKALTKASSIAKKENREIVEIIFKSIDNNKQEIKAKNIGILLQSLQDYYSSFGNNFFINSKSKNKDFLNKRKSIESELELSLVDTFHGSFGLVLGLGKHQQIDIFQETISSQATEYLIELLNLTDSRHIEDFKKKLASAEKNIFYDFKRIINYLVKLESNTFFDWGSTVDGKGGFCQISYERAIVIKDIIEKQEEENPDIIESIGKFELFGLGSKKENRRFVLMTVDKEYYSGYVDDELARELRTSTTEELEILQGRYKVGIKRTVIINEITQESKEKYQLISLEKKCKK